MMWLAWGLPMGMVFGAIYIWAFAAFGWPEWVGGFSFIPTLIGVVVGFCCYMKREYGTWW